MAQVGTGIRVGWERFFSSHPALRWAKTWGISVASLAMGLATVLVFRRGVEYFPLFIAYLLLLWLGGVVCLGARQTLAVRGQRLVSLAIDYAVQTLLHGLLLFLLPLYYASTTLPSGNVWLLLILCVATALTTVDPWYRFVLRRAPWVEIGLFWVALFASLNAAFPLMGFSGEWVLHLSGVVSVLTLVPAVRHYLRTSWITATVYAALIVTLLVTCLWWAREWIPPVPLHLARATFARTVERLEPVDPITRVSSDTVSTWARLTAFTAIVAPSGLSEPVYHAWSRNGQALDQILVTTIRGGRRSGFRAYSWKAGLGPDATGVWRVDVRTVHGQLIGRVQVVVTP